MSKPEVPAKKFSFVGSDAAATGTKISWSKRAVAIILRQNLINGLGAQQAFEQGAQEFNQGLSDGDFEGTPLPDVLPESYTNKNAGSVLYGMKARFLKAVNEPSSRSHAECLTLAEEYGLIQSDESSDSEEPTSDVDDSDNE